MSGLLTGTPSVAQAWTLLVLAGLFEVAWVVGLKFAYGFTRFWPSVATVALMVCSFYLLSRAAKVLPLGTAYAVWTGIGVVGATVIGIMAFQESASLMRVACIVLIVLGVLGLRLLSITPT